MCRWPPGALVRWRLSGSRVHGEGECEGCAAWRLDLRVAASLAFLTAGAGAGRPCVLSPYREEGSALYTAIYEYFTTGRFGGRRSEL